MATTDKRYTVTKPFQEGSRRYIKGDDFVGSAAATKAALADGNIEEVSGSTSNLTPPPSTTAAPSPPPPAGAGIPSTPYPEPGSDTQEVAPDDRTGAIAGGTPSRTV